MKKKYTLREIKLKRRLYKKGIQMERDYMRSIFTHRKKLNNEKAVK